MRSFEFLFVFFSLWLEISFILYIAKYDVIFSNGIMRLWTVASLN